MSREDGGAGRGGRPGGPDRVGPVLGDLLRKLGLDEEVARQEALVRWSEVVGERVAAITRPKGVSRGVLFVEVRSSAWLNELNLMRHEILRKLNAGAERGRVERIVFTLSEGDPEGGPQGGTGGREGGRRG